MLFRSAGVWFGQYTIAKHALDVGNAFPAAISRLEGKTTSSGLTYKERAAKLERFRQDIVNAQRRGDKAGEMMARDARQKFRREDKAGKSFAEYQKTKRKLAAGQRGYETGRDPIESQAIVDGFANQVLIPERGKPGDWNYRPAITYEAARKMVSDANNDLTREYTRSGMFPELLMDEIETRWPHYAPLNRMLDHMNDADIAALGPIKIGRASCRERV